MAEPSARPWHCDQAEHDEFRILSIDQVVASLHDPYAFSSGNMDEIEANAAHIVLCVNLHDELVEAIRAKCAAHRPIECRQAEEKAVAVLAKVE